MKSTFIFVLAATRAASFTTIAPHHFSKSTALHAAIEPSRRSLLLKSLTTATGSLVAVFHQSAYAIETYLTEPTEEFKESERQRVEFRKKQLLLKGDFVKVLARLTGESSTEDDLLKDLKQLRELVITTGGLPLGIKKEDLYKVIRSKKSKGPWPTSVEIAYQSLKAEISYQQSPNTEKDLENPL